MIGRFLKKIICIGIMGILSLMPYFSYAQNDLIDYQLLEPIPTQTLSGKLILSDSPEEVKAQGILYEEHVEGRGRILFHHINCTSKPLGLMIVVCNPTAEYGTVEILKSEVVGPTKHIVQSGQLLLKQYFNHEGSDEVILAPYEEKVLYMSEGVSWQPHLLLTGILDFKTSQEMKIVVASVAPEASLKALQSLAYLERDRHPRGTFYHLDEYYSLHLPNFGKYYICVEQDEDWLVGKDGITQEITMNRGNYGIMYHITIQAEADTRVQFVPRAGVFKGVIRWEDGKLIPIERKHYFKHYKEPVELGVLSAGTTKTLSYMLPNGSAAPVWLQFEVLQEISHN